MTTSSEKAKIGCAQLSVNTPEKLDPGLRYT